MSVVERTDGSYSAVVDSVARELRFLTCCDESVRNSISKSAFATADRANWSKFIEFYENAFEIALHHEQVRNT